jgi:hypothetical protein
VFRYQHLIAVLWVVTYVAGLQAVPCRAADLREIIRQGTVMLESDWAADLNYAYVLKDEVIKDEKSTAKTSQYVLIDGSDYYLPPAPEPEDLRKIRDEVVRRKAESLEARRQRIERFTRAREENGAMLLEVPRAFTFELMPGETVDGHDAYVLSATTLKRPTAGLSRAQKVLSGMKCSMWIDKESFHAIRAECNVVTPVPVYGILARVLPGTRIELHMQPVTESVWLVSEFSMTLTVSKFFLFKSTQLTRSIYSDYRLNDVVLNELLSKTSR